MAAPRVAAAKKPREIAQLSSYGQPAIDNVVDQSSRSGLHRAPINSSSSSGNVRKSHTRTRSLSTNTGSMINPSIDQQLAQVSAGSPLHDDDTQSVPSSQLLVPPIGNATPPRVRRHEDDEESGSPTLTQAVIPFLPPSTAAVTLNAVAAVIDATNAAHHVEVTSSGGNGDVNAPGNVPNVNTSPSSASVATVAADTSIKSPIVGGVNGIATTNDDNIGGRTDQDDGIDQPVHDDGKRDSSEPLNSSGSRASNDNIVVSSSEYRRLIQRLDEMMERVERLEKQLQCQSDEKLVKEMCEQSKVAVPAKQSGGVGAMERESKKDGNGSANGSGTTGDGPVKQAPNGGQPRVSNNAQHQATTPHKSSPLLLDCLVLLNRFMCMLIV